MIDPKLWSHRFQAILDANADIHDECRHVEVRRRVLADGREAWYEQCLDCGRGVRAVKASDPRIRPTSPPFDLALLERGHAGRQERRERQRQEWDRLYAEYLESPEWAAKRQLVMRRAGGVCEGCGRSPASEVHHLFYFHIGDEFLWELVAICANCHARVHHFEDIPMPYRVEIAEPDLYSA